VTTAIFPFGSPPNFWFEILFIGVLGVIDYPVCIATPSLTDADNFLVWILATLCWKKKKPIPHVIAIGSRGQDKNGTKWLSILGAGCCG
jgi:hypothetical protein